MQLVNVVCITIGKHRVMVIHNNSITCHKSTNDDMACCLDNIIH